MDSKQVLETEMNGSPNVKFLAAANTHDSSSGHNVLDCAAPIVEDLTTANLESHHESDYNDTNVNHTTSEQDTEASGSLNVNNRDINVEIQVVVDAWNKPICDDAFEILIKS